MLWRTWIIAWKEFKQISRDPRMLIVAVLLPIAMLLIYGYAINLDVRHVKLAVYDQNYSRESRDIVEAFARSSYFDVVTYLTSPQQVNRALDTGKVKVVIVIPARFSRDLASGRKAEVQILVDGSDSTNASTAIGYVGSLMQQESARIALKVVPIAKSAVVPIDLRTRYWYNPELKSVNFIVPGLIAVILSMLAALLTSVTVVRERERGTIEQLIVSPVKSHEIMIGKLVPYVIIAFADVLLVLIAGTLIFHVPMQGSPLLVLILSGFFVVASVGIGLFISVISPSQQIAMMAANIMTQLPAILLSGFMFPLSSMPKFIQILAMAIPAAHFIKILRSIFLKGSGFSLLWQSSLFLLLVAIVMLAASSLAFKKKLS